MELYAWYSGLRYSRIILVTRHALAIVLSTVVLAMSVSHLVSEYNQMYVEKYLANNTINTTEGKLKELEIRANRAKKLYPFIGGMNRAYTAVLYRKRSGDYSKSEEDDYSASIISEQEKELVSARNKSTNWAAIALNLAYAGRRDTEYRFARQSAIRFGKYEYDTVRMILDMGIRDWPTLDCKEKEEILEVIQYAKNVDDNIIVFRNLKQGNSGLRATLEELTEKYGFDVSWAQYEVSKCQ